MIKEYRQRLINILDEISGFKELIVGDTRVVRKALEDKEILYNLEKKGYICNHELTYKGENFRKKLHEKQFLGGAEGKQRYYKLFNYWAETVRPLAESSEASQRNIYLRSC